MRNAGQSIATLGRLSALVGPALLVGVGGGLAVSAKAAIDFESSFAGVRKTLNASAGEFATLAQDMRELAKEIPVNVNELNRLAEVGGQLGIDVENIESFTKTIAEIGIATPLAADQAALSLARLSNILGVAQEDIFRIGSSLVELGNNFATTEDQIINFALRIAPIGQTAGLTADQVLALGAAFSAVGVPAERGGTAVQRVFISMEEAVLSGGEALEGFADIAGVSAERFAQAYEQDAANAFRMFIEGLAEAQNAGRNVFDLLRNVGLSNQRTFQALLATAGGAEQLARALDLSSDAFRDGEAASEEAQKRYNTTEGQLQLMKNALTDAAIEVGQSLTPAIGGLARAITDFTESPGFAAFMDFLTFSLDGLPRIANGIYILGNSISQLLVGSLERLAKFSGLDYLFSEEGTPFGEGPLAGTAKDAREALDAAKQLTVVIADLRVSLDRGLAPATAAGDALLDLAKQGYLTSDAFREIQREAGLTDKEMQVVGEELWRLGAIAKDQNTDVWWVIRNNMEELHTHSFPRMGRAAREAADALEVLETAAEQADEAIAMLGDTELEGRDAARSFMESVRNLVDAQEAFANEGSIENLFAVSEMWDAMRASGQDLEQGLDPLITGFQEMHKAGAISREEMERGIGEVIKFEQAAMLASGSTMSFVTSVKRSLHLHPGDGPRSRHDFVCRRDRRRQPPRRDQRNLQDLRCRQNRTRKYRIRLGRVRPRRHQRNTQGRRRWRSRRGRRNVRRARHQSITQVHLQRSAHSQPQSNGTSIARRPRRVARRPVGA
jgi:TP901 family phage tail tape measure protein